VFSLQLNLRETLCLCVFAAEKRFQHRNFPFSATKTQRHEDTKFHKGLVFPEKYNVKSEKEPDIENLCEPLRLCVFVAENTDLMLKFFSDFISR